MKACGIRLKAGEACVSVPKAVYSERALEIAAQVFAKRASVSVEESKTSWDLTLEAVEKGASLEALAGDFLVELLNQEYRSAVAELHKGAASFTVTQALFAARGGENPPAAPVEDADFKKAAAALLARGR